jgi:phospho-N-acetylmuramoyl-pentapeptide-transferase
MRALLGPMILGLILAVGLGGILIPVLTRLRARQFVSSDAPQRHQAKAGTPTMGGLIILLALVVAAMLYPRPHDDPSRLWGVLIGTLGFALIGLVDDLLIVLRGRSLGLRAREKLAGQFVVAILFSAWMFFTQPEGAPGGAGRWLLPIYHVLLLVGMSNAVNLTDGLDGLAAGVTLPCWIGLGVLAAFAPSLAIDWGLVIFCAAFAGATLGYLWFNTHPAQVFMGDTGSLAIGGGLAALAIALRQEWLILLIALVPVLEAGSVTAQVISFKTTGRRIFRMSPIHHHFELIGWPETVVVARFVIASAFCVLIALLIFFW